MSDRQIVSNELPESARITAACHHCDCMRIACKATGTPFTADRRRWEYMAFLSGWDEAMERGHGELLAENSTLQSERFDLSHGQHRIIQLEKLASEAITVHVMHDSDCTCDICKACLEFLANQPQEPTP